METCLGNPLTYVADHWWQMALMIFACSFAIFLADVTGLNRPWPLSVILAQLTLEGYPCANLILGDYTIVPLWAVTAGIAYFWPAFLRRGINPAVPVWDYFEDVDTEPSIHQVDKQSHQIVQRQASRQ